MKADANLAIMLISSRAVAQGSVTLCPLTEPLVNEGG